MYRQNRIVKSPLLIIIKEAEASMFVHLKTKTIYSLLEGLFSQRHWQIDVVNSECQLLELLIEEICSVLWSFRKYSDNGIQPIIGCQLSISAREVNLKNFSAADRLSMLFLAKNEIGYRNLMELSSKFFLNESYRSEGISIREIDRFSDGLLCLSW